MKIFVTYARNIGVASLVSASLLAASSNVANAACLSGRCSQNGLVFSQASNDFRITDVQGNGTAQNPFVVYQDVWGLDISLAINNLTNAPQHEIFNRPGFAISIVSRNLTGAFWRFYDHELQETAGYASGENDGLSFAQGIGPIRPYISSHYDKADEVTDVRDFINFYQGKGVDLGETVRFNYFVTDTIPNRSFFIRQRPDYRPNTIPTEKASPQTPAPTPVKLIVQKPVNTIEPPLQPAVVSQPLPKSVLQPVASPQSNPVALQPIPETSSATVMASLAVLFLSRAPTGRQTETSHG